MDSGTGQPVNKQSNNLDLLAKSNWRTCNLAEQRGFQCADSFAQYMGADYDSNGDGQIDSDALRYVSGESEAAYVTKITVTLRSTIRDANTHFVNASTSYDYILSDNTHPDVLRRDPELGRLGLGRGRRRDDRGRQESAVEPLRSRADGLGAVGLQSADAVAADQSRKRDATSAGTPA